MINKIVFLSQGEKDAARRYFEKLSIYLPDDLKDNENRTLINNTPIGSDLLVIALKKSKDYHGVEPTIQ